MKGNAELPVERRASAPFPPRHHFVGEVRSKRL